MAENVKVAVRVRPFNIRETARNAVLIIEMKGNTTTIKNPDDPSAKPKTFAFDYSYWSHDLYYENSDGYYEPKESKYADQKKVFDDLGCGVLDNAWNGYNCSLFAYGQTGSGKSYSMVGYDANKGIVPIFCAEIFKGINTKRASANKDEDYQVKLSMLEIYNEQVQDLLNAKSMTVKGGLKVREKSTIGFYVENLTTCDVDSYQEIENKINFGNKNRTVKATNMNATSSRAHTIVAITLIQKQLDQSGKSMTKTSTVNLVDLAGSERVESTGATGDRLKEGAVINLSLSTLGKVIKALAAQSKGKKTSAMPPYRDSMLTKLLKNALGGNCKTIMIAALSPADINYQETLSTLKFADRAKAIKTTATVNENPTDKLIRELREENARLMELIKSGGYTMGPSEGRKEEVEEMMQQMEAEKKKLQEEIENLTKSYEQRMAEAASSKKEAEQVHNKEESDKKVIPHFWNLNEDPALTNIIIHFAKPGKSRVGNKNASPPPEILLNGLSIAKEHAEVINNNGVVSIKPNKDAKEIMVNGEKIDKETTLSHNDRVLFGPSHLYVFYHPQDYAKKLSARENIETPTFDTAQEEIAKLSGLMPAGKGSSKDDPLLLEDLIKILPMMSEANAMADELKKRVKFEVALVSPQARGQKNGRTEVMVKMVALDGSSNSWLWDHNKFINRKYIMQDMYQSYLESDSNWHVPQDRDPFWEPVDTEKLIGITHLLLRPLAHNIEIQEENLAISDYKGEDQGHLKVNVIPTTKDFVPVGDDDLVEDPKHWIGKAFYCTIQIKAARGLPNNIDKSFCRYKWYLEPNFTTTEEVVCKINADFLHEKNISMKTVTEQFIEYLTMQTMFVEVWGRQKEKAGGTKAVGQVVVNKVKTADSSSRDSSQHSDKIADVEAAGHKSAFDPKANLDHAHNIVNDRIAMGQTSMKLPDVLALLQGQTPELRPVETKAAAAGEHPKNSQPLKPALLQGQTPELRPVETKDQKNSQPLKPARSTACTVQ